MRKVKVGPGIVAAVVAAATLAVYLLTLAPIVGLTDSGELIVAADTLSIAHPPGFPVYVLLGWLFTRLPLGSVAWRLNLMSALLAAGAAALVFLWVYRLLPAPVPSTSRTSAPPSAPAGNRLLAAGCSALVFAFGLTFWNWATVAEVYALQMPLVLGLLLSSFAALRRGSRASWALAGLFFGLGLANHHVMTLLFAPGLLLLLFTAPNWKGTLRAGWPLALGGALLGVAFYLYLPLRATADPVFNWGNPANLQRFWWHVTGRQYQVNLFSVSGSQLLQNLTFGLHLWWDQFTPVGLAVALFGLVALWRHERRLALFSLTLVVLDVAFASHYDIAEDSDAYFLPTFLMTAVWLGWAAYAALAWLQERRYAWAGWGAVVLLVGLNVGLHWGPSDKSQLWLAQDYAQQALSELEMGGTLLTRDWQAYSPLLYLQQVEHARPDAHIIDVELLRRTWYLDYLSRQYPDLTARCASELEAYRQQLVLFEYDRPYDAQTVQERYIALLNAFIREGQPAHVGLDMETGVGSGYAAVPLGVTVAVREQDALESFDTGGVLGRGLADGSIHVDAVVEKIRRTYATVRALRGIYLAQHGQPEQALQTWDEAARLDPDFSTPYRLAGDLYAQTGHTSEAQAAYQQALAINPQDSAAQQGLAALNAR